MTAAANGDIYRAIIHWTLHLQNCYNVLHFLADGTPDIETGLQAALQSTFTSSSANAHFSSDVMLVDIATIKLYPALSPVSVRVCNNPGTDTGDSTPSTCAVVAQIRTASGGRRGRGRFYVPGLSRNFISDSRFTAGTFTWLANITASFITPSSAPRWRLGALSRADGGATIPVNPAAFKVATTLSFDPVLATMKSRRIGRGR